MSIQSAMSIYMNELDSARWKYDFATNRYLKAIGKENEQEMFDAQNKAREEYDLKTKQAMIAYEHDTATEVRDYG